MEAFEYLHKNGIFHLDMKPDNILVDDEFKLKVGDFDRACKQNDFGILTRGTMDFRSPELADENCKNPQASDVYSLGIILFIMKSGGILPCNEKLNQSNRAIKEWMISNDLQFWESHCLIQEKPYDFFSPGFKHLFS